MDKSVMKTRIKQYFRENRDGILREMLVLLKEMVAQKTVNVPSSKLGNFDYLKIRGEEWRVGDIVEREFKKWGIRYDVFSRMKGRPNVIGYVGKGCSRRKETISWHVIWISCLLAPDGIQTPSIWWRGRAWCMDGEFWTIKAPSYHR